MVVIVPGERNLVTLAVIAPLGRAKVIYQQAYTGGGFDSVLVGSINCSSLLVPERGAALSCFVSQSCASTPAFIKQTSGTAGTFPSKIILVPVRFGSKVLANPGCFASSYANVITAGVVQSEYTIVTAALYRYAAVTSPTSLPLPSTEAGFKEWMVNQSFWGGGSAALYLPVVTSITLQNPPLQSLLSFAPFNFSETEVPLISSDTAKTVVCSIPDVAAFMKTTVTSARDLGLSYSMDCRAPSFGINLQVLCEQIDDCLGYTTDSSGNSQCLLSAGRGTDPNVGISRRLLLKPTTKERTCQVNIARSSTVAIYIRQTYLASSIVSIYDGGNNYVTRGAVALSSRTGLLVQKPEGLLTVVLGCCATTVPSAEA